MAKKIIIIDGPIGNYAFSKQFIRNELDGNSKNPVLVQISSLGGSVDHALNIYDQFVAHGNVTAELSAFVASSATIIALGAKTIRMNENSFFLIHKAMNWVDEWGTMNEDEIEELINKLEKQKQQLAKVTLQIAKMYSKKSGKSFEAILDLMKQETWLTAEEALEWGFVDEVFAPDTVQNFLENNQMVAMISASGYPAPPRKAQENPNSPENLQANEDSFFEKIWNRFTAKRDEENPNPNPKNKIYMKKFEKINAVLNVETLESVDNAVSLNEEQLNSVEVELSTSAQAVVDANAAQQTAEQNLETAQNDLNTATAAYDEIDATIADAKTPEAKVLAIRALLAKKPGAKPEGNKDGQDPQNEEVDWDAINKLPHNQVVDQNS